MRISHLSRYGASSQFDRATGFARRWTVPIELKNGTMKADDLEEIREQIQCGADVTRNLMSATGGDEATGSPSQVTVRAGIELGKTVGRVPVGWPLLLGATPSLARSSGYIPIMTATLPYLAQWRCGIEVAEAGRVSKAQEGLRERMGPTRLLDRARRRSANEIVFGGPAPWRRPLFWLGWNRGVASQELGSQRSRVVLSTSEVL